MFGIAGNSYWSVEQKLVNITPFIMPTLKPILTLLFACNCALQAQSEELPSDSYQEDLLEDSPNVVLIIANDLGPNILAYSEDGKSLTPSINSLAKQSVSWENFYISPNSALTRASLFTGRYSIRTKVLDSGHGVAMLSSDEMTLAEVLQGNGYKTALFGTWGLGDHLPSRASDQGFQTTLTHRGSEINGPSKIISNSIGENAVILLQDNYEKSAEGEINDQFFNSAKKFIQQSKQHQSSFFVTISATNTSTTPEQTLKHISAFDRNIGELMSLLKFEELDNNTIVVLLSDSGPRSNHFSSSLKGTQGSLYEGGVRSPLLISWPEKIKIGRTVTKTSAAHIDIMPTLLDACGNGVEEAFDFDGRSLLPLLESPTAQLSDRPFYQQWHRGQKPTRYHHFMVRKGDWKLLNPSDPLKSNPSSKNYELYNLVDDPSEATNVAAGNEATVKELLADYSAWFQDVTETRIRDAAPSYILVDRAKENPLVLTWQSRLAKDNGMENPGFWKLYFEHNGRCDVRAEFPIDFNLDLTGWSGELTIGKKKHTIMIHEGEKHFVFPGIPFIKGRHHLRCKFISPDGKQTISSYQVRIHHR